MVLVSHNIVKCKDEKHPASLSKPWHDILRNELNFSGLILTDDLSMGAIKKYTDNVSEAVLAVNAGNDILLTSDYYMHYNALMEAIKDGSITEDVVNKACRRIIAWKYKYLFPLETNNYTTLIIVSIVLGVLIVGSIILFVVLYLKNRKKKVESNENEEDTLIKE